MILILADWHICISNQEGILSSILVVVSHEEAFTDVNTELSPDGLDGSIYLLLMSDQRDIQLHQLVQAQPRHLLHGADASSWKYLL